MNRLFLTIKYIVEVIKQRFYSSRFVTLIILQFFVLYIYLAPIRNFSRDVNYPVSPWSLPFLFSNIYFQLFFVFIVIYYFSNVPFMHYSEMYQLIRTGRKKWALGKIIGIIFSSFAIMLVEFFLSIIPLIGRLNFENDWGKILYTLSITDAGSKYNILIDYNIINSYTPLKIMAIIFIIGGLLISFIGILMFSLSILSSRLVAFSITFILSIITIINSNIKFNHVWLIYLSPISWFDISNISLKSGYNFPTFSYVIGFLTVAIIILSISIIWKIKTINFQWNRED